MHVPLHIAGSVQLKDIGQSFVRQPPVDQRTTGFRLSLFPGKTNHFRTVVNMVLQYKCFLKEGRRERH